MISPKRNWFAERSLQFAGWEFEGPVPAEKKYVCLAVPHTSNWDGLLLMFVAQSIGLDLDWMIKDSWTKGPLGPLLRHYGAIGIDRSRASNVVDQMIARFKEREQLVLTIPPEGTRSLTKYWKSGFYHIACGAKVPVVPSYLDFSRKRAGLGPAITMTGDPRVDMDALRAFYTKVGAVGRNPANSSPIRLREEDTPKPSSS